MRTLLKSFVIAVLFTAMNINSLYAQAPQFQEREFTKEEQVYLDLSDKRWQWMADKNVEELRKLFHSEAMFVHMGGTWGTEQELTTIGQGFIWYKHADIHSREVKRVGNTVMVYSNIHMTSEVVGNEVTFPFMVTEVYTTTDGNIQLASLIFTRLNGE